MLYFYAQGFCISINLMADLQDGVLSNPKISELFKVDSNLILWEQHLCAYKYCSPLFLSGFNSSIIIFYQLPSASMGIKQSASLIVETDYLIDEQEWRSEPDLDDNPYNEFGEYRLLQNITDPDKCICEYSLVFASQKDLLFYEDSFLWRLDQHYISKAVYFVPEIHQNFCGSSYQARIYIDYPKNRLSDFKDIPYPDNLYCLSAMLQGYQKIYENMGNVFPVCEQQVGIDYEGAITVWLNRDLSKNYPQQYEIEPLFENLYEGESEMVKDIVRMVVRNTDDSTEPSPTFSHFFQKYLQKEEKSNRERQQPHAPSIKRSGTYRIHTNKIHQIVTFQEALSILKEYAQKYSEEGIPPKFTSVIEIYNNDDEVIYGYDDNQQEEAHSQVYQKSESSQKNVINAEDSSSLKNPINPINDSWQHSSQKIQFINVSPHTLYENSMSKHRESENEDKRKHLMRSSRARNIQNLKESANNRLDLKKYGFHGEIIQDLHESSNMNHGTQRKDENLSDFRTPIPANYFFSGDYGYRIQNQSYSKIDSAMNRQSENRSSSQKRTQNYDNKFRDQSSSFSYMKQSNAQSSNNFSPRYQRSFYIPQHRTPQPASYIRLISTNPPPIHSFNTYNHHQPSTPQRVFHEHSPNKHPFYFPPPRIPISEAPASSPPISSEKQNQESNQPSRPQSQIAYAGAINDPYQLKKEDVSIPRPHTSEIFNTKPSSINIRIPSNNAFNPHYYSSINYNSRAMPPLLNNIPNFKNSLYSIHENSVDENSHQLKSHTNSGQQSQKHTESYKIEIKEINRPKYCQSQFFYPSEFVHSTRFYQKSGRSSMNNSSSEQVELDPEIAQDLQKYRDVIST